MGQSDWQTTGTRKPCYHQERPLPSTMLAEGYKHWDASRKWRTLPYNQCKNTYDKNMCSAQQLKLTYFIYKLIMDIMNMILIIKLFRSFYVACICCIWCIFYLFWVGAYVKYYEEHQPIALRSALPHPNSVRVTRLELLQPRNSCSNCFAINIF